MADVQVGFPFRSRVEHDPQGGVAVIQMKDIDDADLLHAEGAIRVSLPPSKGRHLLREGDVLFRSRGRTNGAAVVGPGIGPAVLAAPLLLIRPRGGVHPAYLCWFLNDPVTQQSLAKLARGTAVHMISVEAIKDLDVTVPSIDRQRLIAKIAALANREHQLTVEIGAQTHRLRQAVLMRSARDFRRWPGKGGGRGAGTPLPPVS